MNIKSILLGFIALTMASCGSNENKSHEIQTDVNEQVAVADASPRTTDISEGISYDIEGIKALTGKKVLTESEQDFVLDQYEIFARATQGMDKNAKKEYLKNLGVDGKVVMLVVIGAENSKKLTEAQKKRLDDIVKKYR